MPGSTRAARFGY